MRKESANGTRPFLSLRTKLFLANTIVAAGVLAALWFICSEVFYNTMAERVREDYRLMLKNMNRNIDTVIESVEDYTRVIASARGMQEEIKAYLSVEEERKQFYRAKLWSSLAAEGSDIINPTTLASGMAVFVGEEVVYSGYDISEQAVYDMLGTEVTETAYDSRRPVWHPLSVLKYSNPYTLSDNVFPVSKSIVDKNSGKALGVVVLFVSEAYFCRAYMDAEGGFSDSRYYITDEDGTVLSSSDKEELYKNIREVLGLTGQQYRNCAAGGYLMLQRDGVPLLYSSAESMPGWRLFSVTELNDVAGERNRMRELLLIILAAAAGMILAVSWLAARTVTRPVYQLLKIMKEIEEDRPEARVPSAITGEMGLLGKKFNHLMDSLKESREAFYREQKQKRRNEYKLLQAQMNPHFLYNTIETISSFIKLGMMKEALTALRSMVDFYRLSLSNGREIITMKEELKLTESYLKLQSLRYVEYMDYRIDFDERMYQYRIPKLTLQPLVENAIYHGIKENPGKGMIIVEGRIFKEMLLLMVYDTGKGITPPELRVINDSLAKGTAPDGESFGLGNVAQRLYLIYGRECELRVESVSGSFTEVLIRIPADRQLIEDEETENV